MSERNSLPRPARATSYEAAPRPASAAPFVVALDGPAASGKSSVGLGAATRLGLGYYDTGLLYRVLTWLASAQGVDPGDAAGLASLVGSLNVEVDSVGGVVREGVDLTPRLHEPVVDAAVSRVAAHSAVREAMLPAQRALIRAPGLVMAGRDIGTVIVPHAPLKIWLNASAAERARRRAAQTGQPYAGVLEGMQRRDALDASRAAAPMARAADAVEIDTDGLTVEAVVGRIVALARARGATSVRP